MIVISHDRDLLDSAVDSILHLDGGKLTLYRGGYTAFERQRRERQALDAKRAKKQEAQRKHLQAFVDRFRAKATKARQAQSRLKVLAKLEPIAAIVDDEVRPIAFPAAGEAAGAADHRARRRRGRLRAGQAGAARGSTCASTTTTASRCSAPTATASRRWRSCSPAGSRRWPGAITRAPKLEVGYFAQHQLDELDGARQRLRPCPPR